MLKTYNATLIFLILTLQGINVIYHNFLNVNYILSSQIYHKYACFFKIKNETITSLLGYFFLICDDRMTKLVRRPANHKLT